MSKYLDFEDKKYQGDFTQIQPSEISTHIGKQLVWIESSGVDKTGRGCIFPRYKIVKSVINRQVVFTDSDSVRLRDILECGVRDYNQPIDA